MKWLVLVCFLLSFNANAQAGHCPADESLAIDKLEQELNDCKITYGETPSTADMNNAAYNAVKCIVGVAHKIFDRYYATTAQESKDRFDKLVTAVYDHSHHLVHDSDFARETYTGTMYNTIAIGKAYVIMKEIVKDYIKEIRDECDDAHKFDN